MVKAFYRCCRFRNRERSWLEIQATASTGKSEKEIVLSRAIRNLSSSGNSFKERSKIDCVRARFRFSLREVVRAEEGTVSADGMLTVIVVVTRAVAVLDFSQLLSKPKHTFFWFFFLGGLKTDLLSVVAKYVL